MNYKDKLKTTVLFPANTVKEELFEKELEKKLKEYLDLENREWARQLALTIHDNEEYKEIKSILSKISISDLKKFHSYFLQIINDNNLKEKVSTAVSSIINYNKNLTTTFNFSNLKKDYDNFENNLNILKEDLTSNSSLIEKKALTNLDQIDECDQYLKEIMKDNLKKDLYNMFYHEEQSYYLTQQKMNDRNYAAFRKDSIMREMRSHNRKFKTFYNI